MLDRAPAIVVGAGIGGLACAIALRNIGIEPTVFEKASKLRPVGAGITIQPNALVALRRLGVGSEVERVGARLASGAIWDWRGRPLSTMTPEDAAYLEEASGAPMIGIHRATLHEILLDAVGRDRVVLGRACTGYEQDESGVRVLFEDGSRARAGMVVGADGIHSAIRAQLLGRQTPIYSGYSSYRGITEVVDGIPVGFGGEGWGRGTRFGGCWVDGNRFYWFAVVNAPEGQVDADGGIKAAVQGHFASWTSPVPEIIASTSEDRILRTDIHDRDPTERWGDGAVTLVGDAAHPMTPNLGQGACQAIEDALVLGRELARATNVETGLRAYEEVRQARANQFVVAGRRLGVVGQWSHPVACWFRAVAMWLTPRAAMRKQLLWAWKLPYD